MVLCVSTIGGGGGNNKVFFLPAAVNFSLWGRVWAQAEGSCKIFSQFSYSLSVLRDIDLFLSFVDRSGIVLKYSGNVWLWGWDVACSHSKPFCVSLFIELVYDRQQAAGSDTAFPHWKWYCSIIFENNLIYFILQLFSFPKAQIRASRHDDEDTKYILCQNGAVSVSRL